MSAPHALRYSLAAVWLLTALVSTLEWHGQSWQLLQAAGISSAAFAHLLIAAGVIADAVLGLLLLFWPRRWVYAVCLLMTLFMTLLATLLLPSLWLHPLGPLLKNLPIVVLLWELWSSPSHLSMSSTSTPTQVRL